MRVAVIAPPDFRGLGRLPREEFLIARDADEFRRFLRGADAAAIAPRYGTLLRDRGIVVTNSRGVYSDALAEFVLAAILYFAKDLRRLEQNQKAHRWEPYLVERIEGATAGIIGYGDIGRAVGRRAQAMGMRVLARGRSEGPPLDELIPASDYLVLTTPLTPETRMLMNEERISLMRRSAVLINISRGAVVDEKALVAALRSGRIRGAALDVFETEPLPSDHALWSLENVLISPHTADQTADSHDRAIDLFLRNLERFRRGEPLHNVIDLRIQY